MIFKYLYNNLINSIYRTIGNLILLLYFLVADEYFHTKYNILYIYLYTHAIYIHIHISIMFSLLYTQDNLDFWLRIKTLISREHQQFVTEIYSLSHILTLRHLTIILNQSGWKQLETCQAPSHPEFSMKIQPRLFLVNIFCL